MSLQTYSREYLQSIPQQRKNDEVDRIVNTFKHHLFTAAAVGGTSYRYIRDTERENSFSSCAGLPPIVLTDAELVAGFFARFPGCKVYYEEMWVATGPNTQIRKKGIVIDWS